MKRILCSTVLAVLALSVWGAETAVQSPDGRFVCTVDVRNGVPTYRVDWNGRPVVTASSLGLELADGALTSGCAIAATARDQHRGSWKTVVAERAEIPDDYNELSVEVRETAGLKRAVKWTFRAYDTGVALRYALPAGPVTVKRELTEFRFAGDFPAWAAYAGQGDYAKVPLTQIKPGCERPLVIEMPDGTHVALAEARLVDFARMKFEPVAGATAVRSKLDGPAELAPAKTSPWRVVMAAESAGRLKENNHLILSLNDPCAIADTSWIKPGKCIREVTLTTTGGMACVDFAVKHGLQYVEFDAGWYGHEYDDKSDARAVNLDPKRSKGPLDLQAVIRYGQQHGIGVILYVNRRALEKQIDELLPLYKGWGVKGIKFGFVNVGPQQWTKWLHDSIRKCADYHLLVDVHDEYRPTGFSRTYPNLLTVEGVLGDEATPKAATTLAYAFTRMIAGPADHTVCWTDGRVQRAWTHGMQLAKPVVLFSGFQFLFWYDKPAAVKDAPELAFFRDVPATWDETRVLKGVIGGHIIVARRSGDTWFLGAMNAAVPRAFDVPLDFLAPGRGYTADLYADDATLTTPTKIRCETQTVTRDTVLKLNLASPGGYAAKFTPATKESR